MLAWIGNLLIVVGLYKIGDKWRHAFLFSIAGELLYIARSVLVKDWALAFICVVFCAMAFRNWVKWGEDDAAARLLEGIHEKDGVYEFAVPAGGPRWVRDTYTKPWDGKNGGQAVRVVLEYSDGRKEQIVLATLSTAASFRDAIDRVLEGFHYGAGRRPDQGVTSGRQLMAPRPRTFDDLPTVQPTRLDLGL